MANWTRLVTLEELEDQVGRAFKTAAGRIGLYRIGAEVFACADICPHGQAYLSDGFVEDCQVECPLHQGRFDLRTGEATAPPVEGRIRTFAVEIRDGDVFVDLD